MTSQADVKAFNSITIFSEYHKVVHVGTGSIGKYF